jgi:hypothetical protein
MKTKRTCLNPSTIPQAKRLRGNDRSWEDLIEAEAATNKDLARGLNAGAQKCRQFAQESTSNEAIRAYKNAAEAIEQMITHRVKS